mmetsp:Transcript_47348/g.110359  ORF Transcript_47348/g.110359 Transcript_47348/m.110359 type:complete len:89 (+) Transcript_47348:1452-1718(+)
MSSHKKAFAAWDVEEKPRLAARSAVRDVPVDSATTPAVHKPEFFDRPRFLPGSANKDAVVMLHPDPMSAAQDAPRLLVSTLQTAVVAI